MVSIQPVPIAIGAIEHLDAIREFANRCAPSISTKKGWLMIRHGSPPYLECSSKGDKRFSAFSARIRARGNRSIEEVYQAAKVFSDGTTGLNNSRGADPRSGRWWWESAAPKECGMHCAFKPPGVGQEAKSAVGAS